MYQNFLKRYSNGKECIVAQEETNSKKANRSLHWLPLIYNREGTVTLLGKEGLFNKQGWDTDQPYKGAKNITSYDISV